MTQLLATYLRPYWRRLLFVVALLVIQALANLYLPNLNADIINNGVIPGDIGYILRTGGFMLLVTFLLGIASIVAVYNAARISMGFGRDVRSAVFRQVVAFSQTETNIFGAPSLITRNTNDIQQVQMVIMMGLTVMVLAPIMAAGGVVMAVREDAELSLLIVVIVPILGVIVGLAMSRAIPLFRSVQKKLDKVQQILRENLAGVRVIRAFVRTEHEERRFDDANRDLTRTLTQVMQLMSFIIPSVFLVMSVSNVAILWFGAQRVNAGMPIGNLTAFMQYVMQVLFSVMMATLMFVMIPRAAASGERIKAVLDTPISLHDAPVGKAIARRGLVEFRDVEFRYPGAEDAVLKNISFTAEPGKTTAIIGSTGSGKSSVVSLIPRFYDVTSGAVLIDGVDVREMCLEDLWSLIGLVPQKAFLFSGTVASNVRYGAPDLTDEEVWDALEIAQARDFVEEMPEGLDAPIDQGGSNVSGGQRQRLAIARAVAKRPPVYIFDDSFSAVDFITDRRLREALREETTESTVIIVAQRVGTILGADQIVVLDAGEICGVGTHRELMESCETYREIVFSQLTAEEVA